MLLRPNKNESKDEFVKRFARDEQMKNQCGSDLLGLAEQQWNKNEIMKQDIKKHTNELILK